MLMGAVVVAAIVWFVAGTFAAVEPPPGARARGPAANAAPDVEAPDPSPGKRSGGRQGVKDKAGRAAGAEGAPPAEGE
jgi:hypothetical protein